MRGGPFEHRGDLVHGLVHGWTRPGFSRQIIVSGGGIAFDHLIANQPQAVGAEVGGGGRAEELPQHPHNHIDGGASLRLVGGFHELFVGVDHFVDGQLVNRRPRHISGRRQATAMCFPFGDDAVVHLAARGGTVITKPIVLAFAGHRVGERDDGLAIPGPFPVGRGLCFLCKLCIHERLLARVARCNTALICVSGRSAERRQVSVFLGFGVLSSKWS